MRVQVTRNIRWLSSGHQGGHRKAVRVMAEIKGNREERTVSRSRLQSWPWSRSCSCLSDSSCNGFARLRVTDSPDARFLPVASSPSQDCDLESSRIRFYVYTPQYVYIVCLYYSTRVAYFGGYRYARSNLDLVLLTTAKEKVNGIVEVCNTKMSNRNKSSNFSRE